MAKARRVYCTFCGQTFVSSDEETCTLCGKTGGIMDPMNPAALTDLVAKKREEANSDQRVGSTVGDVVDNVLLGRRLIRLAAGGVVVLGLGLFLLLHKDFRSDPNSLSLYDVLIAAGPLIVGVLLLGAAYLTWREAKCAAVVDAAKSRQPDNKE